MEVPAYLESAWLGQNFPNPHSGSASISYFIPDGAKVAELSIVNLQGKLISKHALDVNMGNIELEESNLSNGIYLYSLSIDNILVDSKRMAIEK